MKATLRQLEVFSTAARLMSFTEAARELQLTQPSVSIQIRQLETAVKMPLFQRVGRKLVLTEAGKELLNCTTGIYALLENVEQVMSSLRGKRTGTLRLGAVTTAEYLAPALVASFMELHPEITIQFTVATMVELARKLSINEIDLMISGRIHVPGIERPGEPFAAHPYIMIAPPNHPLAKVHGISPKRLANERFLTREAGSDAAILMAKFLKEKIRYTGQMTEMNRNETVKQAVMAGLGISLLSMHTVGLELATEKLIALDVVGLPLLSDWCLVHTQHRKLSPIAVAFRDFLFTQAESVIELTTGISTKNRRSRRIHI